MPWPGRGIGSTPASVTDYLADVALDAVAGKRYWIDSGLDYRLVRRARARPVQEACGGHDTDGSGSMCLKERGSLIKSLGITPNRATLTVAL